MSTSPAMGRPSTRLRLAERRRIAKAARATLARRYLSHFVRQAIAAGVVHGIRKVEWGWHLEAFCWVTQMQLEGWLVAYGKGTPEMVERQRRAWERSGAKWEDGLPNPWERYVLVQNELDNLPPGTLKSTIAMVCANAWIWLHEPAFAFGAASGIDANVTRDSNATRDLVRSDWYGDTFEINFAATDDVEPAADPEFDSWHEKEFGIDAKKDAVSDWATTAGGHRYSRTIQRGFTGLHVDGTFIDDPDDADRVWNETARLRPQNRFTRAIENRVNDEHRSIRKVMQQRVHAEDFSYYLLSISRWSPSSPKGWMWFCVPAEFGMQPEDAPRETVWGVFDPRMNAGETMHARLSPGVLADKRTKLPGYEGQYNCNPNRQVNGIFERRFSRFFVVKGTNVAMLRRRPEGCPDRHQQPPIELDLADVRDLTLSVDAANSLDPKPGAKVSAVGLVVGGCVDEHRLILDDRTRVLGVSGTYLAIYEAIRLWMLDRILVEEKALGPSVIRELEIAIRRGWYLDPETDERVPLLGPDGRPAAPEIEAVNPGKDSKVQRAHGMLQPWQRGELLMLDGAPFLYPRVDENRKTVDEGYVGEICSFTGRGRTDRVDATSQFIARYRDESSEIERWQSLARGFRHVAGHA